MNKLSRILLAVVTAVSLEVLEPPGAPGTAGAHGKEKRRGGAMERMCSESRRGRGAIAAAQRDLCATSAAGPLFLSLRELEHKSRRGSRVCKRYDRDRTPCRRALESGDVSEACKRRLQAQYRQLAPAAAARRTLHLEDKLLRQVRKGGAEVWMAPRRMGEFPFSHPPRGTRLRRVPRQPQRRLYDCFQIDFM